MAFEPIILNPQGQPASKGAVAAQGPLLLQQHWANAEEAFRRPIPHKPKVPTPRRAASKTWDADWKIWTKARCQNVYLTK